MNLEDVGPLPTNPPPDHGTTLRIEVAGRPPTKDTGRSIRNPKSPQRGQFMALRHAAIHQMHGRKWSEDAVGLQIEVRAPMCPSMDEMIAYLGGVMDTLDGSQGPSFIYLPIVFLDDCQVVDGAWTWGAANIESYAVTVAFLADHAGDDAPEASSKISAGPTGGTVKGA